MAHAPETAKNLHGACLRGLVASPVGSWACRCVRACRSVCPCARRCARVPVSVCLLSSSTNSLHQQFPPTVSTHSLHQHFPRTFSTNSIHEQFPRQVSINSFHEQSSIFSAPAAGLFDVTNSFHEQFPPTVSTTSFHHLFAILFSAPAAGLFDFTYSFHEQSPPTVSANNFQSIACRSSVVVPASTAPRDMCSVAVVYFGISHCSFLWRRCSLERLRHRLRCEHSPASAHCLLLRRPQDLGPTMWSLKAFRGSSVHSGCPVDNHTVIATYCAQNIVIVVTLQAVGLSCRFFCFFRVCAGAFEPCDKPVVCSGVSHSALLLLACSGDSAMWSQKALRGSSVLSGCLVNNHTVIATYCAQSPPPVSTTSLHHYSFHSQSSAPPLICANLLGSPAEVIPQQMLQAS
jgi:hypothetical protein